MINVMHSVNYDTSLTRLVSYPRTGSHYVRIVIEDCIHSPCAPTSFLRNENSTPWGFHLHDRIVGSGDEGAFSGFDNVIYLYRHPVDTIYSSMRYHKSDDWKAIAYEYKNHLERWLHNHNDCKNFNAFKYEDILNDPLNQFNKILSLINHNYNIKDLENAISNTTIERVRGLTEHIDSKVIDKSRVDGGYGKDKACFSAYYGNKIREIFKEVYYF